MKFKKNGKRLLSLVLALMLCVTALSMPAAATTSDSAVKVRVNGYLVNFPDQAPVVRDNRTLIPVRFVTEKLGAEVTWDGKTRTATIEKDEITLKLTIGDANMTVIKDGKTSTVTMDTKAVLIGDRTMVPIRFVAEELGAWVGYSNSFRTVHIYDDVLTPEEINELQSLPWRNELKGDCAKYKTSGSTFADMNELAFNKALVGDALYKDLYSEDKLVYDSTVDDPEVLAAVVVNTARGGLAMRYTNAECGVSATFRTDASCVFNGTSGTGMNVYGYLTLQLDNDADVSKYLQYHDELRDENLRPGGTYTFIIERQYVFNAVSTEPMSTGIFNRTNGASIPWNN